ncbi:hypothetical protein WMF37_51510 [Sorangium sp. So ce291]|uniref:hypothetical protein n=1 Tax=Sorangium sp. So ce291 TaxID=3133294 RepID=UPI003F60F3C3
MTSTLRAIPIYTFALATTLSCTTTKPVAPVANPSKPATQKASFQGGLTITLSDLNATTTRLPVEPPPYGSISREEYANFAWRQFIYLNSPAATIGVKPQGKTTVVRGVADDNEFGGRNFVTSGDPDFFKKGVDRKYNPNNGNPLGYNQLTWESFAHRSELFPANAPPQGSLGLRNPDYYFSNVTVPAAMARFNNLDENSQIDQNQIFFPKNGKTPSANPYDDYMILFEAKVNSAEYSYINSLLGTAYNTKPLPQSIEFPPSETTSGESMEVKAAWREMSDSLIKSGRYHTAEAMYYTSDGHGGVTPQVTTFGLVGLHILRKTKNYPTFIYTTFEHVDNLQYNGNGEPSGLYTITTYNTMDYTPSDAPTTAIVNNGSGTLHSFKLPQPGMVNDTNGYNIIPGTFELPTNYAGPIPVSPSPAVTDAVTKVNNHVLSVMNGSSLFDGSVWKYYRLAGIQVQPTNEDSSVNNKPDPQTEDFFLANNVIESTLPGIQLFKGGVSDPGTRGATINQLINERTNHYNIQQVRGLPPSTNQVVMGGCMGCHGNAQYSLDKNGKAQATGPTIFNFLTKPETLTGQGFAADVRPQNSSEVKPRTRAYIK